MRKKPDMFFRIARKLSSIVSGKKKFQRIFEGMYQISLTGMNIGGGSNLENSGEKEALAYINTYLASARIKTPFIFDVGANVGNYSILVRKILGEQAKIFSFEPSQKTYRRLVLNLSDVTNLKTYNFGFGNENIKTTLFSDAEESGGASVYRRRLDHYNVEMNQNEEIEIKTIDVFCKEQQINHIHFLKLDVEGHELSVLEGASMLLRLEAIDFIQFEFGGCNIDSKTYFQDFYYLLKDNYRIYRIVKDGLYEINEYKEIYEVFTTTNYLLERRSLFSGNVHTM